MRKHLTLRNGLGLLGALVLGAAGNGLWELIKPLITWSSSAVLDLATFGLSSLRDQIYQDIARGSPERASLLALSFFSGLLSGASLLIGIKLLRMSSVNRQASEKKSPISELGGKRWFIRAAAFYGIILASYLMVVNEKTLYIIRAAAHMEQLIAIADPYLSDEARLMARADFAAMRGRSDYLKLEARLAKVAAEHQRPVPTFVPY